MNTRPGYEPYQPQLVPRLWADGVWTVDGPEVAYKLGGMSIPCPTRMTIVRLADGTLWLHSPVAYSDELGFAVAELGRVSALVAPNSYHHLHIESWAVAHPQAELFAPPDLIARFQSGDWRDLTDSAGEAWSGEIATTLAELGSFSEAVFFHHASRTLIVTDLMQNFEADRVRGVFSKLLLRTGGATGPNGRPSIEIRHAARRHRSSLRGVVQRMIEWEPTGIILAHGKCFDTAAEAEIERAFTWVD